MTTSMSPQSAGPRSNASLATTQSPNAMPTTTRSKRRNDSLDELDSESSGSEDMDWNDDNGKKKLVAIKSKVNKFVARYNKRSKNSQVVPIFTIQNTQSTIVGGTNDDTQSTHGCGIGCTSQPCGQATQAQQELQAPRPTLSSTSTLSSLPSNPSQIFSLPDRPQDSQSEFSQAQSTSGGYFRAGKDCDTCLKHLTGGFYSEFRNHFWAVHYPQDLWYCLFCKCNMFNMGEVFIWQCKNTKCLKNFNWEMDAIAHFSNRHLPCYRRGGQWHRPQPWKEHLQKHYQAEVGPEQYLSLCKYCQKTFCNALESKKHICPFTNWKCTMPAPLPAGCEDHPGADFSTFGKINEHFRDVHFGKSKAGSTKSKRRNQSQMGSIQGDCESRHDNHSRNGNDAHIFGQQDHGAVPTASNPTLDLQGGLSQGPDPQIPHYPQGLTLGDEGGAPQRSLRPRTLAPPVYADPVTDDGRPKFLKRKKSSSLDDVSLS